MDFFEVSAKTEKNLLKMLFLSIAALPFFTTLTNSKESKEKIAYDLEIENNENLNSLDRKEEIFTDIKDNNSLGLNDGDLQKNINVKLVKQVDNNNNTINQKNEKNKGKNGKKKKKCC